MVRRMKKRKPKFRLEIGEALTHSRMPTTVERQILKTYGTHGIRRAVRKKRALGY